MLCLIVKVRAFPLAQCEENWGLNSCRALRKPLIREASQKNGYSLLGSILDWKKIMWSDESRFTLLQNDGHIRIRGEADEVMDPSCLVLTV